MRAFIVVVGLVITAAPAAAQGPAVHPIYAAMPGSMRNQEAQKLFAAAIATGLLLLTAATAFAEGGIVWGS